MPRSTVLRVLQFLFNGNTKEVKYGEMALIPLGVGEKMKIKVKPEKNFDMGEGNGKEVTKEVEGGVVGLIIDARGRRPFTLPEDNKLRVEKLTEWNKVLGTYPEIK